MSNNPYAPPQQDNDLLRSIGGSVTWDGKHLIVPKQYSFPRVCLKCASPEVHTRRTQKFAFTPTWARMMVVFCWPGALVAMALTTKRATLELPLCDGCHAKWKKGRLVTVLATLALLVSLVGVGIASSVLDPDVAAIAVPAVILLAAVAVVVVIRKVTVPSTLQSPKIDDLNVTLTGVDARAGEQVARASA